jgi:hypothetical protein
MPQHNKDYMSQIQSKSYWMEKTEITSKIRNKIIASTLTTIVQYNDISFDQSN